jgi:hypothetical protein
VPIWIAKLCHARTDMAQAIPSRENLVAEAPQRWFRFVKARVVARKLWGFAPLCAMIDLFGGYFGWGQQPVASHSGYHFKRP